MHAAQVTRELELPEILIGMYDNLEQCMTKCSELMRTMRPDVDTMRKAVVTGKEQLAQQAPTLVG